VGGATSLRGDLPPAQPQRYLALGLVSSASQHVVEDELIAEGQPLLAQVEKTDAAPLKCKTRSPQTDAESAKASARHAGTVGGGVGMTSGYDTVNEVRIPSW
jgi:hypothetical protein